MPQKKITSNKIVKKKASAPKVVEQKPVPKKNVSAKKKDYAKLALALHKKLGGKLEVVSKVKLVDRDDWSTAYTPGVGAVSSHVAKYPKEARLYTMKRNTVAVVSDGSAVLGLGNLGALGALPVMEGKAAIFKEMGGVDAFPIVLDTQDTEEIIKIVKAIAPGFGGINLEDISAPRCFEIENRLKAELDIPVMHDDQHGTAIVVLAGLINAATVVGKTLEDMKVVIVGAGAAGCAIALLLIKAGVQHVAISDSTGLIYEGRSGLVPYKKELAKVTNRGLIKGEVLNAIKGADVLVGVSGPGTITKHHIEEMAKDAIVFALANPIPEIKPEDARLAGAAVIATGRSDYANQVNNSLAFPGIFRGALDTGVTAITDDMKIAAAKKIAGLVKHPTAEEVIPSVMTPGLMKAVASVIK
jgi:malate dehydrogenase (oxaloacetate-decarboxylating)